MSAASPLWPALHDEPPARETTESATVPARRCTRYSSTPFGNFDTSAPLGPCLTLADELPDPSNLGIRTWVNGELRQDGTTHNLIFDVPAIIAFLTQQLTLEPGDVIATGTPAGVGLGMKPQVWLQPGDTVRMEVDRIGILENPVAG